MAYSDDLLTLRASILARLTEMTTDPKPSYTNGVRTVSWTDLRRELYAELESINKLIGASKPVEVVTRVGPVY